MIGDGEHNNDGYVEIIFNDGSEPETYYFNNPDFYTHGWVQSHVKNDGVIIPDGPIEYMIKFEGSRIMYPMHVIHRVHIKQNTPKEVKL